MTHILLTGAGFSRNWGGWLADEAFEYLLGCPEITPGIHTKLWKSKNENLGFENTLQELRDEEGEQAAKDVRTFEQMLESMFNSMNNGFKQIEFNPAFDAHTIGGSPEYVRRFLVHFDAIFTLNQDCLLELQYNTDHFNRWSDGRWRSMYSPGIEPLKLGGSNVAPPGLFQPGSNDYQLDRNRQPYFKLHGSSNWRTGDSTLLIMGGNKGPDIEKNFLLRSYRDRMVSMLCKSDTRLVVIGYGFRDQHINEIIARGVTAGAKLFIVDALGVDVLDKAPLLQMPEGLVSFRGTVFKSVMGASRRNLQETFSTDHVERAKVERFLTRLGPGMH